MKLEKLVPAHKKTVAFSSCRRNAFVYDNVFIRVRSGSRNKLDKCFWCSHPFQIGESIALAIPAKGANKVLCNACATELLNSEED